MSLTSLFELPLSAANNMKSYLCVLLLFCSVLHAADAQLPADAQRAMKEYDATVEVAKKRLVAQLQAALQGATTRGQLDAALAIRNKIAELAPGTVPPVGAAPAVVAPMGGAAAGGVAEQVFAIEAGDNKGTLLGPVKKGQRIKIQYVEGTWSVSEGKMRSPEEPFHAMQQVAIIGITEAGEELVALVPGGTKNRTFSEGFKKDYTEVRLRCNDGTRNDNSGAVKYKASIR